MDKDEISREARGIGTYETSITPDQDCCQLFVPKHPATRASIEDVENAERKLDVPGLLKMGLEKVVMQHFGFP
jgi:thiamine biosynthesis protein ThiI